MTANAILRGLVVPFGMVLLASLLLFVAGMLGLLGSFDQPGLAWVVGALWVLAPVVGGLLARGLTDHELIRAAELLGAVLGIWLVFVYLVGAGTASISCDIDISRGAVRYVVGCMAVGTVVGIGMGGSVLLTGRLARRGLWLPGGVLGAALNFGAGAAAYVLFYSIVACLRP